MGGGVVVGGIKLIIYKTQKVMMINKLKNYGDFDRMFKYHFAINTGSSMLLGTGGGASRRPTIPQ